jgi:ketosteroid isomerase-like protein
MRRSTATSRWRSLRTPRPLDSAPRCWTRETIPTAAERYHGREEIRSGFGDAWASAPVRVEEIREVVVYETTDREVIVAEQQAAATVTATGRRFTLPFLLVLRARDGHIVHVRDYADALRGARELDRLPALIAAVSTRRRSAAGTDP